MTDQIEFWVTLIKLTKPMVSAQANRALCENCTHVRGNYWTMEGDTDYLRAEGVPFIEVTEGSVCGLGGLTELQRVKICRDYLGVEVP